MKSAATRFLSWMLRDAIRAIVQNELNRGGLRVPPTPYIVDGQHLKEMESRGQAA